MILGSALVQSGTPPLVSSSPWVAPRVSLPRSPLGAWRWRRSPARPRTCVLPLWSSVCHGRHFISFSYPCHYLPALFQRARYMVALVCLRPLLSLGTAPGPCRHFFRFFPRLSIAGFLAKPAVAWTTTCATGSQPWHTTSMVSSLRRFPTTLSRDTISPPLRCVCGALPAGDTITPPLAVLLATFVDLSPSLSATALTAPCCITSLPAPLTATPVRRGLAHAAFLWLTRQRGRCTGGFSTPWTRPTRQSRSVRTFALLGMFAASSNHFPGVPLSHSILHHNPEILAGCPARVLHFLDRTLFSFVIMLTCSACSTSRSWRLLLAIAGVSGSHDWRRSDMAFRHLSHVYWCGLPHLLSSLTANIYAVQPNGSS